MRFKERNLREIQAALAARMSEVREMGALAGLAGTAISIRELLRPELEALAVKLYGPPKVELTALEERIHELNERRRLAEQQAAAYLDGQPCAAPSPLPGWRRGVTVLALAGLAACGLSAAGLPMLIWLGVVACLAAILMVNAAGLEDSGRAFTRWFDYRRSRWRSGRLSRQVSRLQRLRYRERERQLQLSHWIQQHLSAFEAQYDAAGKLAERARTTSRAMAA